LFHDPKGVVVVARHAVVMFRPAGFGQRRERGGVITRSKSLVRHADV
jgi:hypothetical protein